LLPQLSRLSVSYSPGSRLRHWCSAGSLRISLLHPAFHCPLEHSSPTVSKALPGLSPGFSPPTYRTAYTPFTPNKSGQRSPPTYYRGCWHVVSRGFLTGYRQLQSIASLQVSFPATGVYNPKAFVLHAASLHQPFGHCAKFPTAASRRSLGRVSVPVWPVALSGRLPIVALVGRYPAN
jgi:hypothetical protein